ncbi:MAG: hypothetical protein H6Q56_1336 [Deltaproteobacteria bacterium]|nr:hypothetical protein [Deltaproteobacteria bacterium]
MTSYNPMRALPTKSGYGKGDVLVLCGELFGRGYANGIVEEATRRGMTIIGTTVGRRETDGTLRHLTAAELHEAEQNLGGRVINIPLEAGFDLQPADDGRSPADQLKGVKPDAWESVRLDWDNIEQARLLGLARFKANLASVVTELEKMIPANANVLFAHIIGGGMPRARMLMPVFNKVFKGQGERYLSSAAFWGSELGRLCKLSFDEVTADTFAHLIEATDSLRQAIIARGHKAAYSAYGYHGCEALINGTYTWQSYTPYVPGWAKMRLEEIAAAARSRGIGATVFNSPEIQTNSSALFMGVEIPLYLFLEALQKEGATALAAELREECRTLLRDDVTIEQMLAAATSYLASPVLNQFAAFETWPHHNTPEQAELMLNCSARLMGMNRNPKEIVCAALSTAVVNGVGKLILDSMWEPKAHVYWLNHDIIARRLAQGE